MNELFPESAVSMPSPRLLWAQKIGIAVRERPKAIDSLRFKASKRLMGSGYGPSAEDACMDFAHKNKILNWNESEWQNQK